MISHFDNHSIVRITAQIQGAHRIASQRSAGFRSVSKLSTELGSTLHRSIAQHRFKRQIRAKGKLKHHVTVHQNEVYRNNILIFSQHEYTIHIVSQHSLEIGSTSHCSVEQLREAHQSTGQLREAHYSAGLQSSRLQRHNVNHNTTPKFAA